MQNRLRIILYILIYLNTMFSIFEQIVGYFVFQTEVLHGLTLRHRFRFVGDEQIVVFAIILTLSITNKFALHSLNRIIVKNAILPMSLTKSSIERIQNHCCYTCLLSFELPQRRSTFLYFRARRHFRTLTSNHLLLFFILLYALHSLN